MRIFMSPDFIDEVRKILKSKAHSDCEDAIIEGIYKKAMDDIVQVGSTKKIGGSNDTPFVRKRLEGIGTGKSGGYRLYFWAIKVGDEIYLLFIHPKKGRRSSTNITPEYQKQLAKDFVRLRGNGGMIITQLSEDETQIHDENGTHLFP